MIRKARLFILIVCVLSVIIVGCTQEEPPEDNTPDTSLQEVKEKGTFILGLYDDMPPLSFVERNDEIAGFDLELMTEVANRMGLKIQVETINSENGFLKLINKEVDVINGVIIDTETETNEEIEFSKPYVDNRSIMLVRSDSDIQSKDSMQNRTVGLVSNSEGYHIIDEDKPFVESIAEIVEYDTDQEAMTQLGIGAIDAAVVKETFGKYVIKQRPSEFRIIDEMGSELHGIGFRKEEDTFREEMDRIINEMKEDGTLERISKKWFGNNLIL